MPRPFQIVCLLIFSSVLFSSTLAYSQTEGPAVVTFTIDFPTSQPEHYSIRVQSDGLARYQSSGRRSPDSDENDSHENDSFDLAFTLAAKAGYFQKDVDSHQKDLAFTGKKTLAYKDARRSGESTYNYSHKPAVQDMTSLMQSLSATLEFGHRLQYDHQYQKLALDEELKRMEGLARTNELIEVAAIQPILDQIVADQSVINVTRARAQRLLERAGVR